MDDQNTNSENNKIPAAQKWIAILWPSFLVASIETVVFFTLFDPQFVFGEYDITRTGAYTVGFFLFWVFAILPSILTLYFAKPCRPCIDHKDHVEPSTE